MDFRSRKIQETLPLVTIGISSYNYSSYIVDALNSVLAQTYEHIEVIIIDDCSKDDCPKKIADWISANNLKCTFIVNEINQGITKVSNQFLKLAKGKYLNLFATDDEMLPEKIAKQVALLEEGGDDYGLVYSYPIAFDEDGVEQGMYLAPNQSHPLSGYVLMDWLLKRIAIVPPATLIRMEVYKKAGIYDERVLFEDYNFWLRILACYKILHCSYPAIKYRVKKHSGILSAWNDNNKERYYHDRILSHQLALGYINDPEAKNMISKKTNQYLKAMASNKSRYLKQDVWLLIKNGYFKIPIKILIKAIVS